MMRVNIPKAAHCMFCEKTMRVSTFAFEEGVLGSNVNVTLVCDEHHTAVIECKVWDWTFPISQGDIARAQGVLKQS